MGLAWSDALAEDELAWIGLGLELGVEVGVGVGVGVRVRGRGRNKVGVRVSAEDELAAVVAAARARVEEHGVARGGGAPELPALGTALALRVRRLDHLVRVGVRVRVGVIG